MICLGIPLKDEVKAIKLLHVYRLDPYCEFEASVNREKNCSNCVLSVEFKNHKDYLGVHLGFKGGVFLGGLLVGVVAVCGGFVRRGSWVVYLGLWGVHGGRGGRQEGIVGLWGGGWFSVCSGLVWGAVGGQPGGVGL